MTHTRTSDPPTSHAAGVRATEPKQLRASQARVLAQFKMYGDLYDKQLVTYLNEAEKQMGLKPTSPSGARSRRAELCAANTERMAELHEDWMKSNGFILTDTVPPPRVLEREDWLRATLRREGFRSPLWDTGVRVSVDGYSVIVWGVAR